MVVYLLSILSPPLLVDGGGNRKAVGSGKLRVHCGLSLTGCVNVNKLFNVLSLTFLIYKTEVIKYVRIINICKRKMLNIGAS